MNGGTEPVRAGGQALADGVLMRTDRAWAIAREDGSIEVGQVPHSRFSRIPVVRVLAGLVGAMRLGIVRGMLRRGSNGDVSRSRRINRRFLLVLLAAELTVVGAGWLLERSDVAGTGNPLMTVLPWVVVLAAMRLATPGAMWRYHGAEHKAVSAHEAGIDLRDTSAVLGAARVHDRCGTNLVFVMALLTLVLTPLPGAIQFPVFLMTFGASVEVISLAAKRPRTLVSRMVLSGGKFLQRYVTTAEPTPAEQAVGCRALLAALAEHERLVAAESPDAPALAVAA